MIRILYVPFFSNLHLAGCSIFNNMKVIWKSLVDRYEDVQLFYPYPDDEAFDVTGMEYLKHPRIKFVPVSARRLQSEDVIYVPADLMQKFNTKTGEYHVDLVVCDKQRVSTWVDLMLNDHVRAVGGNIPIVNYVQWPTSEGGARTEAFSEAFEYSQVMGMMVGWNVWGGANSYKGCLDMVRRWGSPRVVKHVIEKSFHGIRTVMDCARLDELTLPKPKDRIYVNYASRFGAHYEFESVFEEIEKLYQAGRSVKLVITSPSAQPGNVGLRVMRELKQREMDYDLNFRCPQEKFYGKASECHVSLWLIKDMGPSLSLREQVYLRQAVVIPRTAPYMEMLPDYPYTYEDPAQMRTLLRYVVDNYWSPEVQTVLDKYRAHVKETTDVGLSIGRWYDFLNLRVEENRNVNKAIVEMIRQALDDQGWPDRMTYEEFRALVRKGTRTKRDVEVNYTGFSRNFFRWALPELGYVDSMEDFKPVFKRTPNA